MTRGTLTHLHQLRVRYAETDQMGVVYHANHLIWFHEARDALLREIDLPPDRIEAEGWRFPVVDVACRYLAAARYGDVLTVRAVLEPAAVARMTFRYTVTLAGTGRVVATGQSVSVITDRTGRLLLRTPEHLDRALQAALAATRPAERIPSP